MSLWRYSRLLMIVARPSRNKALHCCIVRRCIFSPTRRVRGAKRVALLSVPVIDYTELCCQGFLTIRACRRACNLTIGRLTSLYMHLAESARKITTGSRCGNATRFKCGGFKGRACIFTARQNICGSLIRHSLDK